MQVNIIYFTSTGNTLWLATKAKEIIEQQGHEVKLYEVIKDAILICDKTINNKKYKRYKGPGHKIKPVLYRK